MSHHTGGPIPSLAGQFKRNWRELYCVTNDFSSEKPIHRPFAASVRARWAFSLTSAHWVALRRRIQFKRTERPAELATNVFRSPGSDRWIEQPRTFAKPDGKVWSRLRRSWARAR